MSAHAHEALRSTSEVIEKSNELLKGIKQGTVEVPDEDLQKEVKKKVDHRIYETTPSYHPEKPIIEGEAVAQGKVIEDEEEDHKICAESGDHATGTSTSAKAWSKEEQAALEAALKAYPAATHGAERWNLIAAQLSQRSKKEIMARVKELALAIQAKKVPTKESH